MRSIIGITGTNGAGKGAVVSYLLEQKGFAHHSASSFIVQEILRRGLTADRDSMISVGNELRASYGADHIIRSLYTRARASEQPAVIESLRALGEVRCIKALGGFVIGVDAEPEIRYQRALLRGSVKDGVSFEKFIAQELSEMNDHDLVKGNLLGALAEADIVVTNNGTLRELHEQVEKILAHIRSK